jgi:biotin operon repressor
VDIQRPTVTDLARLLKVIADETRLRILGAIAERPLTGKDLAERLELTPPTISHHMRKLTDTGIVTAQSDAQRQWYSLNTDLLLATRRMPLDDSVSNTQAPTEDSDEETRFRAKVLRDFFDGERLKEIPAQRKRRVIVLQHLMERFEPNRDYRESEVNEILSQVHDDFATMRRELVDYGYMTRDRGIYQVTRGAPKRSKQVQQEITGNELDWIRLLLSNATRLDPSGH